MSTATKTKWVLDPTHSLVEFSVRHMMIATVKGQFADLSGEVYGEFPDMTTTEMAVTVKAASVNTRDEQRDGHLRSADFFAVEEYPELTFRSKQVKATEDDTYRITGDLTIRGVTREVQFTAQYEGAGKDPWGQERVGFSAEGTIDRREFGLNWNAVLEAGGFLVADKVHLAIHASLIKQA